jgi:hypothetical protein
MRHKISHLLRPHLTFGFEPPQTSKLIYFEQLSEIKQRVRERKRTRRNAYWDPQLDPDLLILIKYQTRHERQPGWLMIDVLHGSIPRNALVLTETHAGHAGSSAIET